MGTNVTLAEATSEKGAKDSVADRLGVRNRPWVVNTWRARVATKADVEKYGALVDASKRGKGGRATTVSKLRRKHRGLFDGPDAA